MEDTPQTQETQPSRDELYAKAYAEAAAEDNAALEQVQPSSAEQDDAEAGKPEQEQRAADSVEKTPDSPEPSAEKKTTPERGPDGKFLKSDAKQAETAPETKTPEQDESKYAKAKERQARA